MTLTLAAARVADIATEYLADRGYDRCSLTEIAELAGMRKASLYSHFRNKDALFTVLLERAVEREREYARQCFAEDARTPRGGRYLQQITERFSASPDLRFLLRTAYAPPESIRDEVTAAYQSLTDDIQAAFRGGLPPLRIPDRSALIEEAYLGAIDGVQVELLYGPASNAPARREALWAAISALVFAEQLGGSSGN